MEPLLLDATTTRGRELLRAGTTTRPLSSCAQASAHMASIVTVRAKVRFIVLSSLVSSSKSNTHAFVGQVVQTCGRLSIGLLCGAANPGCSRLSRRDPSLV